MEECWRAKGASPGRDGPGTAGVKLCPPAVPRGPFQLISQFIAGKLGFCMVCQAGMVEQILETLCGPEAITEEMGQEFSQQVT